MIRLLISILLLTVSVDCSIDILSPLYNQQSAMEKYKAELETVSYPTLQPFTINTDDSTSFRKVSNVCTSKFSIIEDITGKSFLDELRTDPTYMIGEFKTQQNMFGQLVVCPVKKSLDYEINWEQDIRLVCMREKELNGCPIMETYFQTFNGNEFRHCHAYKNSINKKGCFQYKFSDQIWDVWEFEEDKQNSGFLAKNGIICHSKKGLMETENGMWNWYSAQPSCSAKKMGGFYGNYVLHSETMRQNKCRIQYESEKMNNWNTTLVGCREAVETINDNVLKVHDYYLGLSDTPFEQDQDQVWKNWKHWNNCDVRATRISDDHNTQAYNSPNYTQTTISLETMCIPNREDNRNDWEVSYLPRDSKDSPLVYCYWRKKANFSLDSIQRWFHKQQKHCNNI